MNKGLTKDVYLYFNNEADNDNIATSTNGCFPAKNLVNMAPTGDSLLSLYFKSMINTHTNGTSEEVVHDVFNYRKYAPSSYDGYRASS